jgi:hypothetical protein
MPLLSYVSISVVNTKNGEVEGYVRVPIDHPFTKLQVVSLENVLVDDFSKTQFTI